MADTIDTADFFRPRLAEMIDLRHPLAVLASRLAWTQIEAAMAPYFARRVRASRVLEHDDLFGPSLQIAPTKTLPLTSACPRWWCNAA